MSVSFVVRGPGVAGLTAHDLRMAVPYATTWKPDLEPDATGSLGGLSRVYRPGLSTRAIEVSRSAEELSVRILVCSAPEDHELALALTGTAAALAGVAEVETEQDGPMPPGELLDAFDRAWIEQEIAFGASAVLRIAEEQPGRVANLAGPVRPTLIGPRVAAEIRTQWPGGVAAGLVAVMRRTQWPGDARTSSVFAVSDGDRVVNLAVLAGGSRTILPDVHGIAIPNAGEQLYLTPDSVVDLLPDHARFLDERQVLVEPVEPDRWAAFLAIARGATVALEALGAERNRTVSAT